MGLPQLLLESPASIELPSQPPPQPFDVGADLAYVRRRRGGPFGNPASFEVERRLKLTQLGLRCATALGVLAFGSYRSLLGGITLAGVRGGGGFGHRQGAPGLLKLRL